MTNLSELVKEKLNEIIQDMADHKWLFVTNPGHDFTREDCGKLSFQDTIKFVLSMGKGTISDELIDFFKMDTDLIPTSSALVQRRAQIVLFAFEYLFNNFSASFPQTTARFKDHCILAVDGCHVVYVTNSEIIQDYNKPRLADYKGYNHMHLNGFIDAISKAVIDVVIQPGQQPDERQAFHIMLDHFSPDDPGKYIATADRGYESYDMIFHCILSNIKYVFRAKAPSSKNSILSTFIDDLPDDQDEFDVTVKRFFTDKKSNIIKEQSNVYLYMNPSKNIPHFKPLLDQSHLAYISFRVVKLKMPDGSFEYIITNLPSDFDLEDIRECYHWRWGAEITFRYLKHAAGLLYFHSKKQEFLKQEIYASLVMYNFGIFLANEAADEYRKQRPKKEDNKYEYTIDFSTAIRTARKYYLRRQDEKPIDIIQLLFKFIHAVKERFRQFKRPLRGIGAVHFNYR